ncbi:hypothetical protein WICPIJ_006614 [Wickerhamomyces pijperi]|uniref:Nuclear condensin complex subunit 3 C-terminal domain-containing protein n=1 Tax=Wickerhamomyces pijperi TaxID=599730 RepID=A0A9P8TK30_WICPI|nr:hypothetical protein WICPIJ_006614 [Wickerhamomyces pijperi]
MAPSGEARRRSQYVEQITTQDQIKDEMAKIFQECQSSIAGHKKQVLMLKAIQSRSSQLGHESFFNDIFLKLINKVLVVKKSEPVGDRVVKFVSSFLTSLQSDYAKDEEEDKDEDSEEQEDNVFTRLVTGFITHLLYGIEAKDKNVRYRIVQLLDYTMLGLGEIDNDLYEKLTYALNERLKDKEPYIRIKALHCIARFQELPEETDEALDDDGSAAKMVFALQNDPSAEVRRAALLNVFPSPLTNDYILERARDINPVNRRILYSRIMKNFGDFRTINRQFREKLLSWGLKDRDESVQAACVKMFSVDWLETLDGDLIEFIQRLHVAESEIAELAMKHFFQNRKDLVPMIKLPLEKWENLDPEISYLARCFYQHCSLNKLSEIIDENFPESAKMAELLTKYLNKRKELEDEAEVKDIEFIVENLLVIAVDYDYSDEIGRRSMLQAIRSALSNENMPDKLNRLAIQVLRKLSINEGDFCTMVSEMVFDLRDEMTSDIGNDLSEEEQEVLVHCLSLCKHMLSCVTESNLENISLKSLTETLIVPAMNCTKIHEVLTVNTETLGLCCLLDHHFAGDHFYYFGICLAKGDDELRNKSLKIMFDVLSIHGTKVLDIEGGVDTLSFNRLIYKTLKDQDRPELQALCSEGLCKLFLADVMTDDELFETLVVSYYDPKNSDNQSLLQAFTFCLPVYCFSHPQHQMKMASIATDAFKRLCKAAYEADRDKLSPGFMVSPTLILQQLIHWTDPMNVVNQSEEAIQKSETHLKFILDLLNSIENNLDSKFRRAIFSQLSKFNLYPQLGYDKLLEVDSLIKQLEDVVSNLESISKSGYNRFQKKFAPILEEAKKFKEEEEEMPAEDREYSMILENQGDDNEQDGQNEDEIDEEYEKEVEESRLLEEYERSRGADRISITAQDLEQVEQLDLPLEQGTPPKSKNEDLLRMEGEDDVDISALIDDDDNQDFDQMDVEVEDGEPVSRGGNRSIDIVFLVENQTFNTDRTIDILFNVVRKTSSEDNGWEINHVVDRSVAPVSQVVWNVGNVRRVWRDDEVQTFLDEDLLEEVSS